MARILVVDDDEQLRKYLSIFLRNEGHFVAEAADGDAAAEALQAEAFDLVVTDISMPGMDGLELIRAIRERQAGAGILAISGAGWDSPDLPLKLAKHFGADSTLLKPFGPSRFRERVASLLKTEDLCRAG